MAAISARPTRWPMVSLPRVIHLLDSGSEREPSKPITGFVVPLDRQDNSMLGGIAPVGKARVVD